MPVNLDEARAARREAGGKAPVVIWNGKEHELAPELPFGVLEALRGISDRERAAGAMAEAAQALLGQHYQEWLQEFSPTVNDLEVLLESILPEYGISGEA